MKLFNATTIYTVHIKPDDERPYESAIFVREGFHFMAFLFSGFWALYAKLWWVAGIFLGTNLLTSALLHYGMVSDEVRAILLFALQIWVAFNANDFVRDKLKKQGYIIDDIVTGADKLSAELRFFDRHAKQLNLASSS